MIEKIKGFRKKGYALAIDWTSEKKGNSII